MQAVGGGGGEAGVVVVDHVKTGVLVEEGEDACGGGGEGVGCCFLGCHGEGGEEEQGCEGADLCVTRYVWKRINDSITQAVDTIMIEQLVEESRRIREEKGRVCSQSCEKKNGGKQ